MYSRDQSKRRGGGVPIPEGYSGNAIRRAPLYGTGSGGTSPSAGVPSSGAYGSSHPQRSSGSAYPAVGQSSRPPTARATPPAAPRPAPHDGLIPPMPADRQAEPTYPAEGEAFMAGTPSDGTALPPMMSSPQEPPDGAVPPEPLRGSRTVPLPQDAADAPSTPAVGADDALLLSLLLLLSHSDEAEDMRLLLAILLLVR